jgi:CheY-like chemotaxis protein
MSLIIYIDDDKEANKLAYFYLKKYGYDVLSVENTKHAREIIERENVSLIITDVGIPGESGPEFYRALKNNTYYKNIPFIFVSGHAMGYDESLLNEKQHFMQKPIFFPDLVNLIKFILESLD